MGIFHFQNVDFYYECEEEGFPLLFLHGLGGDMSQCKTMLKDVHGFRKVFLDARGHGKTNTDRVSEQFNFVQFARDAFAFMENLGYRQFIAGGISMGAATVLNLALAFSDSVKALILIRPAWLNKPCPENLKIYFMIGELLRNYPMDQAEKIFMESKEYNELKINAPSEAESSLSQFRKSLAKQRCIRLIQMPSSVPFKEFSELKKIQAKTLILAVKDEPAHPLFMAEKLAGAIPEGQITKVTSKNEDMNRYHMECSNHINCFLTQIQGEI